MGGTTLVSRWRGFQGVSSLSCSLRHGVREAEGERPTPNKPSHLEEALFLSRCIATARRGARARALSFFASACDDFDDLFCLARALRGDDRQHEKPAAVAPPLV